MSQTKQNPTIVLFGRANVGKSTLFNKLAEKNIALTSLVPGTTRDANFCDIEWLGYQFKLVDTGGIINVKHLQGNNKKNDFNLNANVQQQAREHLKRADLILFLVDAKTGLLPPDKEIAIILKKILNQANIILVANKADSPKLRQQTAEFNKLALGEPLAISAANGSGTGDLLDEIIKRLKKKKILKPIAKNKITLPEINVSIIGKPNVGKSSLINSLAGENRIIVSSIPHTTREPQDIKIEYKDFSIKFVDTAGISRQGQRLTRQAKIRTLEKFSIGKSLATLKKADIALLVIDIKEGLSVQEAKLVEAITKQGVSLILIANKWDLVKNKDLKYYCQEIYKTLPFATWAPAHFASALTGSKVKKIPDLIIKAYLARQINIKENALAKFLNRMIKRHKPTKASGTKTPHIYTLKQTDANPPHFIIRIGAKDSLHQSYVNFIANRLRDKFEFFATPIKINVEKNPRIHGKHERN